MIKKGTKLYSIFYNKCPQCHEGRFWKASSPIKNMFKIATEEHCSHCGLKYEREVGFWYGAMYVSYALGVASFVTMWIATTVLLPFFVGEDYSVFLQIGIVVIGILLFAPYNLWLSRLIWINFFVKYKAQ